MTNPSAIMHHPGGGLREIQLSKDKSRLAKNKGWPDAVTWQPPVGVRRTHENMNEAALAVERHPQFHEWKREPHVNKRPKDT